MFQCDNCLKTFARKANLNIHLNKGKTKCSEKNIFKIDDDKFLCPSCPNKYVRKYTLEQHIKKEHPNLENKIINAHENYKIISKYEKLLEMKNQENLEMYKMLCVEKEEKYEITKQIEELKELIRNMPSVNNITNNNITNNINNNIDNSIKTINNDNSVKTINVRPFSYENDSYITDNIMDDCVNNPYEGVVKLTKMIHFNPNHPENYNIFMSNRKKRDIKFFNNKKWKTRDKKSALMFILNTQTDRIGEHLDKHPEKFKQDKGFIENILYVITNIETHETKMKNDSHYRNMVNNIFKIIEDNSDKVTDGIKNETINVNQQHVKLNYDTKKSEVYIPLHLEPTKIID